MRGRHWLGASVAVTAVVVMAGTAMAMTGGGEEPGSDWEDRRRAELKNLGLLSGEPYTDEEIELALDEERQFPQEVQEVPLVDGADEPDETDAFFDDLKVGDVVDIDELARLARHGNVIFNVVEDEPDD